MSSFYLQTALAPGLAEVLARARAHGATTSVDPNWDASGGWDGGLRELLPLVDVLLPNAAEACRIAAVPDVEAAAGGGPVMRSPAPLAVAEPVDAVGAGDTFDAGLLAGWLAGAPLEEALALAGACGALSLQAAGGTAAQPTLEEARAVMAGGAPAVPSPRPDHRR